MASMILYHKAKSVVHPGIRLKLIFLILLNVVLCLVSVDAASCSSITTEAPDRGTCNFASESNESLSETRPLMAEAVKDLVGVPVTIANGTTFNMATHVYNTKPEDGRDTQGNGVNQLCSHRQDIALVSWKSSIHAGSRLIVAEKPSMI